MEYGDGDDVGIIVDGFVVDEFDDVEDLELVDFVGFLKFIW